MDFLKNLKEAMSHGISKEEFLAIWSSEMNLKCNNNTSLKNTPEDATVDNTGRDETTGKENDVMPLLMKIVQQQNAAHKQQARIEQQLKDLQSSNDLTQQMIQQKIEQTHNIISEKVLPLEAAMTNLQQSFKQCVSQSVQSESLCVQEKIQLMTDAISSFMLKEMRNILHGMAGDVSPTPSETNINRMKQVQNKCGLVGEIAAEETTTAHNGIDVGRAHTTVDSSNVYADEETQKMPPSKKGWAPDAQISDSFRQTLYHELNTFLVKIQKLLLCPLNSEDVSFFITDRIKELFQQERITTADQLLNVQTAISSDIHARLYRLETYFKQQIETTNSYFEQNESFRFEFSLMLEEISKLKNLLHLELPTRLMSNVKSASDMEFNSLGFDVKEINKLGSNTAMRPDGTKLQTEVNQFGKGNPGHGIYKLHENNTNFCPTKVGTEQVQTVILMLLMYMLTFIVYHDSLCRENTSTTSKKNSVFEVQSDTSSRDERYEHVETSKTAKVPAKKEKVQEFGASEREIPRLVAEASFKLMQGQHKVAKYLCHLKYYKQSLGDSCLNLKDIDPGYNLRLHTNVSCDNNNLNFHLMAVSGEKDNSLTWPATFNITIMLDNKKPNSRQEKWQSFSKTRSVFKPLASVGHSALKPFCFFKEEIIDRVIDDDDNLVLHIAVQYIKEED